MPDTRTPKTTPDTVYSTLGCLVSYCWETQPGTRPATGYEVIYDCVRSPSIGGTPDKVEVTPLSATKNKAYISLLQELSETDIVCNMTSESTAIARELASVKAEKQASNLAMWVCVDIASADKGFFCRCMPSERTISALEPNQPINEMTIPLDILGDWTEEEKPTYTNHGTTSA